MAYEVDIDQRAIKIFNNKVKNNACRAIKITLCRYYKPKMPHNRMPIAIFFGV